jgi:hypothetical protein
MIGKDLETKLNESALGHYIEVFEKNGLDNIDVLTELSEDDYEKIGISVMGDRKKLLKLFAKTDSTISYAKNDTPILQDNMCGWIGKKFGFNEQGTLTLFGDRFEWEGKTAFKLYLKDVNNVTVKSGLTKNIQIDDKNGRPNIFQKTGLQDVNPVFMALAGAPEIVAASTLSAKTAQLEEWKRTIDKLRGQL